MDEIEPRLNEAISALRSSDRDVILLRFFDGLSLLEVAQQIQTTEDTARKRVARAVDRLRACLQRKDVSVPSGVLAMLLAERAADALPSTAHASLTTIVGHLAAGAATPFAAGAPAALIHQGVVQTMQATTRMTIAGIAAAVCIGGSVVVLKAQSHADPATDTARFLDVSTPPTDSNQADSQSYEAIQRNRRRPGGHGGGVRPSRP